MILWKISPADREAQRKSQEQARTRKLIHLGSHALKYYFLTD